MDDQVYHIMPIGYRPEDGQEGWSEAVLIPPGQFAGRCERIIEGFSLVENGEGGLVVVENPVAENTALVLMRGLPLGVTFQVQTEELVCLLSRSFLFKWNKDCGNYKDAGYMFVMTAGAKISVHLQHETLGLEGRCFTLSYDGIRPKFQPVQYAMYYRAIGIF